VEDHIDEEKLIMQLIEKKKKELEERKNTPVPENNTASVSNIDQSDAKM
jgi:CRISPR/Cas system CSM-associated protein Csm5 (group 7 of RAMP superfamily)